MSTPTEDDPEFAIQSVASSLEVVYLRVPGLDGRPWQFPCRIDALEVGPDRATRIELVFDGPPFRGVSP